MRCDYSETRKVVGLMSVLGLGLTITPLGIMCNDTFYIQLSPPGSCYYLTQHVKLIIPSAYLMKTCTSSRRYRMHTANTHL